MIRPPAKRFQYSLAELLAVVLTLGGLQTFIHTREGAAIGLRQNLLITFLFMGSVALGAWWSFRKRETGWRRRVRVACMVLVVLPLAGLAEGRASYTCWRCGAHLEERYGVFSQVEETDVSKRVVTILDKPCPHPHWHLNCRESVMAIIVSFVWADVPLFMGEMTMGNGVTVVVPDLLDQIPDRTWAADAIDAMGDRDNCLKYGALLVIMDLSDKPPHNDAEWQQWWLTSKPVFQPTTSLASALPIAQAAVNNSIRVHGQYSPGLTVIGRRLAAIFHGLKVPP